MNGGSAIDETNVASPLPPATGGNVTDGLYFLSKREIYTGPCGASGATGHTAKTAMQVTILRTG